MTSLSDVLASQTTLERFVLVIEVAQVFLEILPLLAEFGSVLTDLLKLDSVAPFLITLEGLFSSVLTSSFCLRTFVRRGLRGVSADELGRSSDELALD